MSNKQTEQTEFNQLVARLKAASYAYHNGQTLLMTDDEYDAAIDRLRDLAPAHPFLAAVGAPVAAGDEATLPIPLPSLNKIKGADGSLVKWLAKYSTADYHVSTKLDGCSALWLPVEGKLYTRGDGLKGRDISAFARYFQGLSTKAKQPIAVRGELIMRTDSAAIPIGKLSRNIVAGALNRKANEVDVALFREIRFVAYELVRPASLAPAAAFDYLRAAGFEVATALCLGAADVTEATLSKTFTDMETASPYQLDGIVVAPNVARAVANQGIYEVRATGAVNPADRVAWKTRLTASSARTTVRTVEWNVSASGVLVPRVLFDTVTLAGANIGAATGLHGRWIYDNAVGPGAVIEVRRAGDVIPQIIVVHVPAPGGPAMPVRYTWDSVHIRPVGDDAAAEAEQIRMTRALSELGAENVGAGMVAKLYDAGFTTLAALYAATPADFAGRVAACKDRAAEKIWNGLRVKQTEWTECDLLVASCVMPRGVGRSKLQPLLEIEGNVSAWPSRLKGARPAGLSEATIDAIVDAVPAYLSWRTSSTLHPATVASKSNAAPGRGSSDGPTMVIVFTNVRDKALEAALVAAGHTVADAVTKKTTHVIHPDGPTPASTKITKGQEYGAAILPIGALRALLETAVN
jgi:NAD-dependent DNA ligase